MSLTEAPIATAAGPPALGPLARLWNGSRPPAMQRLALAGVTMAGAAAVALVYFGDPSEGHHAWYPPCPFHAATGWYCPGCGSTRGLHLLLHGHLLAACRMNTFMVLCVPYLAFAYLTFAARVCFPQARRANPNLKPIKAGWIWLLLALIVAFWVLRNLPFVPFTSLAPH